MRRQVSTRLAEKAQRVGGTAAGGECQALDKARQMGLNVPAPAGPDSEDAGLDRLHGQLFQIVFVSNGVCRVLLRLDDCPEAVGTPDPPEGPEVDDRPVTGDSGTS